jgi:hypothetical protein
MSRSGALCAMVGVVVLGSCGGDPSGGGLSIGPGDDAGSGGRAAGDAGVAGEAGLGGGSDAGSSPDPFVAPATCTSGMTWTRGNHGSSSMNPGRACLDCHATMHGPTLTIAGTVYPTAHEPDLCDGANGANGAAVVITGADGQTVTLTPNAAGNIDTAAPVKFPFTAKVTFEGRERAMSAKQTSGDCNGCHTQAGASGAPGRILLP